MTKPAHIEELWGYLEGFKNCEFANLKVEVTRLEARVARLEKHFEYHDKSFHQMMVDHGYKEGEPWPWGDLD